MTPKETTRISKFLSLILRHKPETIDITLDKEGWVETELLIKKLNQQGVSLTVDKLKSVVEKNNKKRFSFSDDFRKIRANQGHSIEVDLKLEEKVPPPTLYHGTIFKNLESIRKQGLLKDQRHHVHLSADKETALQVGMRYGKPIVLTIDSKRMHSDSFPFYQSENGVWLADHVPLLYIQFPL